ncbi:MAG: endonuclease III [Rickettsiales bacterium]|jgi:endonuclease-3|nr:endonuclease III [Rickettsiales bacterium]
MTRQKIGKIFSILAKEYDQRGLTELSYSNPYTLLVSVMLSAQSTDVGVNRVTSKLFRVVQTPEDAVNLGFDGLRELIKSINYNNTKAKHILSTSRKLIETFDSKVPGNMTDLVSLDGVGRKTANIVLNIIFGIPTIAVDTHVFRVSNRLGIAKAKTVLETERQLLKTIPKKYIAQANNFLVLFGRYQCKALKPLCSSCALRTYCDFWGSIEKNKIIQNGKNSQ